MSTAKSTERNKPTTPVVEPVPPPEYQQDFMPLILRMTWMIFGKGAWIILALMVAQGTRPVVMDIVFWTVVAGLIVVRYVDITRYHGETTECVPATLQDWKTYSIGFVLISAAIYGLARISSAFGWMV